MQVAHLAVKSRAEAETGRRAQLVAGNIRLNLKCTGSLVGC